MNVSRPPFAILAALVLPAVLGAAGCVGVPAYQCKGNDSCVSKDGAPGICEANGSCSFADTTCTESGRRYPEGAGEGLASTCVRAAHRCVTGLSLGAGSTCALRSDGAVYCWGDNTGGKLGDGTTTDRASPTQVGLPGKAVAVAAAEHHACALLDDSTVWCWGSNEDAELGVVDQTLMSSPTPVEVMIGSGMPPTFAPFKAKTISAGGAHTCAIDLAGKIHCWGENQVGDHGGQCGQDPAMFPKLQFPTPIPSFDNAVAIGTGDEFGCALKDDKSTWCWGDNENGELGTGSGMDSFVPVQVASLSSVGQLISGDEFACALKNDSSLRCWGYGGSGVMGASLSDQPVPALITNATAAFAGGSSFHICATQKGGDLLCWGANEAGQLGTGDTEHTNIAKPTPAKLITVESAALGDEHTCALTQDGALWCWGDNSHGQLGIGHTSKDSIPLPRRVDFPCP